MPSIENTIYKHSYHTAANTTTTLLLKQKNIDLLSLLYPNPTNQVKGKQKLKKI